MAEQLRRWHFQLLVRRGQQIEQSCTGPTARANFEKERDLWLDDFLKAHHGKLDAQLESLTSEHGARETWLHVPATDYTTNSRAFAEAVRAYRLLRIDHQHGYAAWVLA